MRKGLIMEGGAMRGMFTAGVIDIMVSSSATTTFRIIWIRLIMKRTARIRCRFMWLQRI